MLRKGIVLAALACALNGCASQTTNLISLQQISGVVNEVKRQTSVYVTRVNYLRAHPEKDEVKLRAKRHFVCGKGDVDFDLTSVKLDLATTADFTTGASFSTTIPSGVVTLGPSISNSFETTNSQELVFTEYPANYSGFKGLKSDQPAPIAIALLALREALIMGATNEGICFTGAPPKGKGADDNTFKLSITVVNDTKGGVTIGLGPMSFGPTQEAKSTTGNAITVGFKMRGKGNQFFLQQIR